MSRYPENKTFCPYPWIHVMTQPTGTMSWCCVARGNIKDDAGQPITINVNSGSMSAAWNSEHMKEVRLQMISGEKVKGCEHCYYLESVSNDSYRIGYIRDWMNGKSSEEITRRIEYSKVNAGEVDGDPIYLDFRLGNLCNLKCRMCQPQNSSQIYKEQQRVIKIDPTFKDIVVPHSWGHLGEVIPEWWDSDSFLEDTIKWLPKTIKMYFTGGEPTLIERNYWIMQKAIELGVSDDMEIMFNTNCTNLRADWKEILSHFNKITACLSIDAIGDALEYIRTGANWETIKKNIDWYIEMPNVTCVLFSPVIMSLNIFNIKELLLYIEEVQKTTSKKLWISYLMCDFPEVLDLRAMPQELRDKAIVDIKWLYDQPLSIFKEERNREGLATIINVLENKYLPNAEALWEDCLIYMKTLDKYRNQSLYNTIPQLKETKRC